MSVPSGSSLARRAALAAWGLFTLALVFIVGLLVHQLTQLGLDPLSLNAPPPSPVAAATDTVRVSPEVREVAFYFVDSDGRYLSPERRELEIGPSTIENCRKALGELIAGPQSRRAPLMPETTEVRALFALEDGTLVVDFSPEVLSNRRTSAVVESLLVQGLAHTLTQEALTGTDGRPPRRIQILMNGSPIDETAFSGHIDLSGPYGPDSSWVQPSHG